MATRSIVDVTTKGGLLFMEDVADVLDEAVASSTAGAISAAATAVIKAGEAEASRAGAESARDTAVAAKDTAVAAAGTATTQAGLATTAKTDAITAKDASVAAKDLSVSAKDASETAAGVAVSAQTGVSAARDAAEDARDLALQYRNEAEDFRDQAEALTGPFLSEAEAEALYQPLGDTGDVSGPASSTDGYLALFDGASGKLLKMGAQASALATQSYVTSAINALIAAAPGALDTLDELAAALGDDANFAATMTTALAGKQAADSDLTAIAALSTTTYGRALLTLADAAALKALISYTASDVSALALSGGVLTGRLKLHALTEKAGTYTTGALDVSTGTVFDAAISANATVSFSNLPGSPTTGDTVTAVLRITISSTPVITWPSGIKWLGGTAPTIAAGRLIVTISASYSGSAWVYDGSWGAFS